MVLDILLLIAGIAMILMGANALVDNSSIIARKFGISEFVIGIIIIGIGTSLPEFTVSLMSAIQGKGDMAIGNVVGSNIFNTFMILGITALISPIKFENNNIRKDVPYGVVAALLLFVMSLDKLILDSPVNQLSRVDGAILFLLFALYIYLSFKSSKNSIPSVEQSTDNQEVNYKSTKLFKPVLLIIVGLVGLILGGRLFVNGASAIAKVFGISDAFIGITILAGGTSLPELASCVVAARKGKGQMALGNIIGSNVSNIFLILGAGSLITPLQLSGIGYIDLGMVLFGAIALLITAFTFVKKSLDRFEGGLFVVIYIAYIVYLASQL